MTTLDFGSLNDALGRADPYRNVMGWIEGEDEFRRANPDVVDAAHKAPKTGTVNLLRSAGPISDRYILSAWPASLIVGPGGSGKTIASAKKALVEAQRMKPGGDGVRRYVLGTWRQKYVNIWKATIPSWWKVFPRDLPGSKWSGASPREAEHTLTFQDRFGIIQLTNRFRAFGETADPDDVLGNEFTDCYLNEWPTLPEELFIALVDRVGRDPPQEISGRVGRFFGDGNAPDVMSYIYRDFFESLKPGYQLFLQPSGLSPEAENIEAVGREYYQNSAAMNAHRPWWIKRMIHVQPGYTRSSDPVYPKFDDTRNVSIAPLAVIKELPVLVGVDGGATPAAAYMQETSSGQLRILAEVAIERGRMRELATGMLAIEQRLFTGCSFHTVCDPAMCFAEDTEDESDRQLLQKYLGRKVAGARTQEVGARVDAVGAKFDLTLENGLPGLILNARECKGLRRGFNQTFHYRPIAGTDDRGAIAKTFDSHVHDALQYGALECGSAEARRRVDELRAMRQQRREAARDRGRYDPYAARRLAGRGR
jgi:hypothetical protein